MNNVIADAGGEDADTTGFEQVLAMLHSRPDDELLALFVRMRQKQDAQLVGQGLRAFSAQLLARGLISMSDYAGLFGGQAIYHLTRNADGCFVHVGDRSDAQCLARRYSMAKYGSIVDIRFFAGLIIGALRTDLDIPQSALSRMLRTAHLNGEQVVMLTTGWRNVPSTANVMYEIVIEQLNITLAYRGLPTIISVKLPRIAPPCENYASLSLEEREQVSTVQDHILPAENFYRWPGVHVLFGDDVLVTGATADKVYAHAMRNGAKSFMAIYPLLLDPLQALNEPATEEVLNTTLASGQLDDTFAAILQHPDYVPILRSLRALLDQHNLAVLANFLPHIPLQNLLKLFVSALNNEFLADVRCMASLDIIRHYLVQSNALDAHGYPLKTSHT